MHMCVCVCVCVYMSRIFLCCVAVGFLEVSPMGRVSRMYAVCCSVLQCVAVCCSVWQCVAVCGSVFQCVAMCCSVLQRVAVCYGGLSGCGSDGSSDS